MTIHKIHTKRQKKTYTCLEGLGVGDTHFTGNHIGGDTHITSDVYGDTHITVTPRHVISPYTYHYFWRVYFVKREFIVV